MTTSAAQLRTRVKDGGLTPADLIVLTREAVTEPQIDATSRRVKFVISDATRDRAGDSLYPEGCDARNYTKNPVVLFAHDKDSLPVAKCVEGPVVEKGQLVAVAEFLTADENPFAELVFQQVKKGVLRAVSVGFLPRFDKMVWNEVAGGIDFVEWELLEFSVVPVPCNPNALAVDGKGIDELEALVKDLRSRARAKSGGQDAPPATGSGSDQQAFLDSLGTQVRELTAQVGYLGMKQKALEGQISLKATMLSRMDAATKAMAEAAQTLMSAAASSGGKTAPAGIPEAGAIEKAAKGHILSKRQYARAKAAIQTCSEMLADHHAAAGAPEGEPDDDESGPDADGDGDGDGKAVPAPVVETKAAPVEPADALETWKAEVKAMGLDPDEVLREMAQAEARKQQGRLD